MRHSSSRGWRPLLAAFAFCVASSAQAGPTVTLRLVADGLNYPTELINADDGSNRLFVVSLFGTIHVLQNGSVPTPFLDLSTLVLTGGERGMLGLAFHPDYPSNGAFYVFYTRNFDGALTIARYLRSAADPNVADPASGAVILTIPHPINNNHNGGRLVFGPDGYLYIGVGDGGGWGDPNAHGQDRSVLLGKLLRIAVDGGTGYTIPAGNPYASASCAAGTCPEIWAYGLRNPWKFSFDSLTGDLFIGDVGEDRFEEVDLQPASATGGTNYGWGVYEGNYCYNDNYFGNDGACAALAGHTRPILTYSHGVGIAITGGYRYRGANAALKGYYVYGDYGVPHIFGARVDRFGEWASESLATPNGILTSISSFGEDESGELYVADLFAGKVYAIDGPPLSTVVSRKSLGFGGTYDLSIDPSPPIGGSVSIEPRGPTSGSSYQLVFKFSVNVIAPGSASCTDGEGNAIGTAAASYFGNQVFVTLDGVPDRQRVQVALTNVNGSINVSASVGFLLGDVDGSGAVTASDILRTKGRLGQATGASNFVHDVDLSGGINEVDLSAVKVNSGVSL